MSTLRVISALTGKLRNVGLIAVLVFTVFTLYFGVAWQSSGKPVLGIYYPYGSDATTQIVEELQRLRDNGFQILCIPFEWSSDPTSAIRVKTDVLFEKAEQLGLSVFLREHWSSDFFEDYLYTYASKLTYVQAINEADAQLIKEWYVPGQLVTRAQQNAEMAKRFNPDIKTVASFATPLIPTLIRDIAEHVDIIALDIYEHIQLATFPLQVQTLLTLSSKNTIWLGELGYATLDDKAQADFLITSLNLSTKSGVEAVVIWGWTTHWPLGTGLSIRGRLAETEVANWVKG